MADEIPANVMRQLRELAAVAHETALSRALASLAAEFDRWRRGEIGSFQLADSVHQFHEGPTRQLWERSEYHDGSLPVTVAHAIANGLLDPASVPEEVQPYVMPLVEFWRDSA